MIKNEFYGNCEWDFFTPAIERTSLLLILYHIHIFILLRHIVRRECLWGHRTTHRATRKTKVRCRVAGMTHVVTRLTLIIEVVHLRVIWRRVVVIGVVLIILIMPEIVRLMIGNIGEWAAGLRCNWWRWCCHNRRVRS